MSSLLAPSELGPLPEFFWFFKYFIVHTVFEITVKHQMLGPELNQIFAICQGFFLVRQFTFVIDYTQTNIKSDI